MKRYKPTVIIVWLILWFSFVPLAESGYAKTIAQSHAPQAPFIIAAAANFAILEQPLSEAFARYHAKTNASQNPRLAAVTPVPINSAPINSAPIKFVFAATGQLVAQSLQGAPFDLLLSADYDHLRPLIAANLIEPSAILAFARGRLALYSSKSNLELSDSSLTMTKLEPAGKAKNQSKLAIANPKIAPYGVAAVATLRHLGVYEQWRARLVYGQSIAQIFEFVRSGNAEYGLIAYSQAIYAQQKGEAGSLWLVPRDYYAPLLHYAVILRHHRGKAFESATENPLAIAFLKFLQSDSALELLTRMGYEKP